jgi:hypothetical protein
MRIVKVFGIITCLLLMSQAASPQISRVYDAVRDFSTASNPNGVWSYGYLTQLGTPLILYTSSDNQCMPGMSWWGLLLGQCNFMPVVGHNDTDHTFCWLTNCLPPTYLMSQPGWNGELSVVRWTAPKAGKGTVSGAVTGVDCTYPTSSTFYMVLNTNQRLLSAPVDSCDLPLTFEDYQLTVQAGDTLDFVVDWGPDGSPIGDGTGIQFKVTGGNRVF